jgi:uncharacterized short protein YbdD (DUF466 family)
MRKALERIRGSLRVIWHGLRQWSGDEAYETYIECATRNGDKQKLSPSEFYVEQLNRRYSRPNRCC